MPIKWPGIPKQNRTVKLKILYIKPPSYAMNKTTTGIFIQVQQKLHLKKDMVIIKDLLTQQCVRMILNIWKIKRRNSVPQIKWRILRKCSRFNRSSLRCNLCLNKKLEITLFKGNNILQKSFQRCIWDTVRYLRWYLLQVQLRLLVRGAHWNVKYT